MQRKRWNGDKWADGSENYKFSVWSHLLLGVGSTFLKLITHSSTSSKTKLCRNLKCKSVYSRKTKETSRDPETLCCSKDFPTTWSLSVSSVSIKPHQTLQMMNDVTGRWEPHSCRQPRIVIHPFLWPSGAAVASRSFPHASPCWYPKATDLAISCNYSSAVFAYISSILGRRYHFYFSFLPRSSGSSLHATARFLYVMLLSNAFVAPFCPPPCSFGENSCWGFVRIAPISHFCLLEWSHLFVSFYCCIFSLIWSRVIPALTMAVFTNLAPLTYQGFASFRRKFVTFCAVVPIPFKLNAIHPAEFCLRFWSPSVQGVELYFNMF